MRLPLATLLLLGIVLQLAEPAYGAAKKLVEFGWDEPNSFYLQKNITAMERLPFDGLVCNVTFHDRSGGTPTLAQRGFSHNAIAWSALLPAAQALQKTRFRRFTENFVRFNVQPGDVDWFDDFHGPLLNARLAGRTVRYGKLRGVFLDLEQYGRPVFAYARQRYRATRSFAAYATQVRIRGQQLARAFQQEAPGLTLFLSFGYDQAVIRTTDLTRSPYGLLPSFLDGLLEGVSGKTTIVDGFEASYDYYRASQFESGYQQMHTANRALSARPEEYDARVNAGFGLWLDFQSDTRGWNTRALNKNFFTPARFTEAVTNALRRSDRYVWIYTQQPQWWTAEQLPTAYISALARARRNGQRTP